MKRSILFWMVCLFIPSIANAQKNEWGNGLYWELNNGVLIISGNGAMPSQGVPWHTMNGVPGENVIEKVVIGLGVTNVRERLFLNYKNLKTVSIGHSVTDIGADAFCGCTNLMNVSLPSSLKTIGFHAFSSCEKLQAIVIPNGVASIPDGAFSCCYNLESVTIPISVVSIGKEAFLACKTLNYVNIPSSVTSIGEDAFSKGIYGGVITISKEIELENKIYFIVTEEHTIPSGSSVVRIEKKCGLKDNTGKWIIPLSDTYSEMICLTSYLIKVKKNNLYGLLSVEGKVIVPTELEALATAGEGFLKYKLNGFWGVMNYSGKIIIDTDRGYTSIGDFVTFTKRFPYTMLGYKGECDVTGKQISKIKVETPQQTTTASSSSNSSSSSSNTGKGTTTVVVEHHRDPVPIQEWHACFACGGMGTMGCDGCGGSGTKYIGDRLHRCGLCNGTGIKPCNVCFGNKGQYTTVYR